MSEPQPDITAAMDQAGAFMGNMAKLLGQFFRELLEAGFQRSEAMELVCDYFAEQMAAANEDED